jgi:hypothetical protein
MKPSLLDNFYDSQNHPQTRNGFSKPCYNDCPSAWRKGELQGKYWEIGWQDFASLGRGIVEVYADQPLSEGALSASAGDRRVAFGRTRT